MSLRVFPVSGSVHFADDYNQDTSRGRRHDGVDIFGAEGTPLLAVDDGQARYGEDGLGGHVVNLRAVDGTRYYYAHLSAFEGSNRVVKAGDVIGYMGHTGNAANTPTHLHFEMHPDGGEAVDPFAALSGAQRRQVARRGNSMFPLLFAGAVGASLWWYAKRRNYV